MNIVERTIAALLTAVALGYFFYRVIYLLKLLKVGKPENRYDRIGKRIMMAIRQSIFQGAQFRVKTSDHVYAGIMHIFILWGFLVLLFGEIEILLSIFIPNFDFAFLGNVYPIYILSQDIFVFLVTVAMIMAFARRFLWHPRQINYHIGSYLILIAITILMLTILGMNIEKFTAGDEPFSSVAQNWAPFTMFIKSTIFHPNFYHHSVYMFFFWTHLVSLLAFLDYIPNSKHLHVLAAIPANFFRRFTPPLLKLAPIDFEDENLGTLGVASVRDMTWKQLFDGYSCTECGRCTELCPANNTGKLLSPREIILNTKDNLFKNANALLSDGDDSTALLVKLIGGSITQEEIWACTTCGACTNVCPVGNEHLRDIVEIRQNLVMEEGSVPALMGQALKSIEARQHPFFGTASVRSDWRKNIEVPFFDKSKEYLLWIGCSIALEERNQKIAQATVGILKKAGVSFGILENERCTGDPARRMGDEYQFSLLATENISEFNELGVKKIITMCPHCFNSFKNDYPDYGGNYEVAMHSILIDQLIKDRKIKLKRNVENITFHDPCYLSRHNGITEEPREALSAVGNLIEMKQNRKNSFCCGGGGGLYWSEEKGERINQYRAKEALSTGADIVATSCPFCMSMMTDGIRAFDENEKILDIAEIVYENMIK
ncbi:MAG: (Fe-S)-binding protein [Epsilonproteobacteria bacterium]|nr:(Fe-S)-binding protein [Campylobacterota bacterium]